MLPEGEILGGQTEAAGQVCSDQKIKCLDDAHGRAPEVVWTRLGIKSRNSLTENEYGVVSMDRGDFHRSKAWLLKQAELRWRECSQ